MYTRLIISIPFYRDNEIEILRIEVNVSGSQDQKVRELKFKSRFVCLKKTCSVTSAIGRGTIRPNKASESGSNHSEVACHLSLSFQQFLLHKPSLRGIIETLIPSASMNAMEPTT